MRVQVVAGRERHRDDGLRLEPHEGEPTGQDPDHRVGLGVERDAPSPHGGIAAEAAAPEALAQQHHAVIAPALVGRTHVAPHRGRDSQGAEELRGHDQDADALGLVAAREVDRPRVERGERPQRMVERPVLVEAGRGGGRGRAVLARRLHELQLGGARVWQRAQQQRIHHGEHDGVGADAQGEHEQDHGREAPAAAHHAQAQAQVLREHVDQGQAAPVAVDLPGLLDAAQLDQRRAARVFARHPRAQVVLHVHLQVALQLLREFALAAVAVEQAQDARPQRSQRPHHDCLGARKRARMVAVCSHSRVSFSTWRRPARVSR